MMHSRDVVILTRDEFDEKISQAFARGVERGKFEQRNPPRDKPVKDGMLATGRLDGWNT